MKVSIFAAILYLLYTFSRNCHAVNQSFPEWMQVGISDSDLQRIQGNTSAAIFDSYIFMKQTCARETTLGTEVRNKTLPSHTRYLWPVFTNKLSYRVSSIWQDSSPRFNSVYPHHHLRTTELSSITIFGIFLGIYICLLLLLIFLIIPFAGLLFYIASTLYALLTCRAIRMCMRAYLIRRQKWKRQLEIARTPDSFRLDPPYTLPPFFRKDPDDEFPEELEEYDSQLKRKHNRLQSEIKISDRFGNYMQQRGVEYDPLLRRFRPKHEELPEDAEEAAEMKKRLKAQQIQQARELLAQESDYITNIPSYRIKAIELGIPYAEDEHRSIVLTSLQKTVPKKKSKPSALNVIPRVIKPKKSKSKSRNPDDVEAGPDPSP